MEEPPRASFVEFGQSHLSSLVSTPHIDLCGLAHNSDRFNQRLVRVQSTFLGDEHHQHIYDSTCGSAGANIQVVYPTGDTRASLIRAICELNRAGCDRGFFEAGITVIGRFEVIRDSDRNLEWESLYNHRDNFKFLILDVERVEIVPSAASNF